MTPTDDLRRRLRRLLDERIPSDGADTDTRFLDADIDDLLEEARSLYEAASMGWTEKAGMYQREMGDIEAETVGQESYRLTALKDRLDYALKMAAAYAQKAAEEGKPGTSLLLGVARPEVL